MVIFNFFGSFFVLENIQQNIFVFMKWISLSNNQFWTYIGTQLVSICML
jgi:hypothetical protein